MSAATAGKPRLGLMPLATGLFLALLATAASFLIVLTQGIDNFPEIVYACARNFMTPAVCQAEAMQAGTATLVTHSVLCLLFLAGVRFVGKKTCAKPYPVADEVKLLFLTLAYALFAVHLVRQYLALPEGSRIDNIEQFSKFISLENFLWPLLIQLYVLETNQTIKTLFFGTLMCVCMLTPYRAVGMAIAVFAFILPFLAHFFEAWKAGMLRDEAKLLRNKALVTLIVFICIGANGMIDTASRTMPLLYASDLPKEMIKFVAEKGQENAPIAAPSSRLMQRLAYPLYQAGIVHHLAGIESLPGPMDEIRRKLLLSDKPTLNQYVYQRIYLGHGVGQTTALSYGEASAYAPSWPWLWMLGAPVLLLGFWYAFCRRGIQLSSLIGLALWRSSQAGFVTLIPGLTLQLGGAIAMAVATPFLTACPAVQKLCRKVSFTGVCLALAFLAGMTFLTIGHLSLSDGATNIQYTTNDACTFDVQALPAAMKNGIGHDFRYNLSIANPQFVAVTVPAGKGEDERHKAVRSILQSVVRCPAKESTEPRALTNSFSRHFVGPLHVLALAALLVALLRLPAFGRRLGLQNRPHCG